MVVPLKTLSVIEVLRYKLQYVNENAVKELVDSVAVCEDCPLLRHDEDINDWDCVHGLDYTDPKCPRSSDYASEFKVYAVAADFRLRDALGDLWEDEYTAR